MQKNHQLEVITIIDLECVIGGAKKPLPDDFMKKPSPDDFVKKPSPDDFVTKPSPDDFVKKPDFLGKPINVPFDWGKKV